MSSNKQVTGTQGVKRLLDIIQYEAYKAGQNSVELRYIQGTTPEADASRMAQREAQSMRLGVSDNAKEQVLDLFAAQVKK